jgi:hypothetical protein
MCSQALAFMLTSLNFLDTKGHLVAILPLSCLKSEKDQPAWHYLRNHFAVETIAENERGSFNGCVAKTLIVHLAKQSKSQVSGVNGTTVARSLGVRREIITDILRGRVQVHQAKLVRARRGFPFIHSTEVTDAGVDLKGKKIRGDHHFVQGPAVLLPRVGKPTASKVVVYGGRNRIVLSDCVLALKCQNLHDAIKIRETLQENWQSVARAFSATCAPYVTVSALAEVLRHLGFQTTLSKNGLPKSHD